MFLRHLLAAWSRIQQKIIFDCSFGKKELEKNVNFNMNIKSWKKKVKFKGKLQLTINYNVGNWILLLF